MLLAFTLGPAEIAVLLVLIVAPIFFVYRAGKNAGRAEAMKEQLERDERRSPPSR
jgi:hypothetical protein